jgi:4-aminobutyrate aminotransferase
VSETTYQDASTLEHLQSNAGPRILVKPPGPRAREIIAQDHQYLSTSLSRTADLVGARAHGAYVEDVDGNVYLDFGSGISVTVMGHTHPHLVDAIRYQAGQLIHINSCDYLSLPQVEYARRISALTPGSFQKRVFFSNSGSEAVETAIKAAVYHTKRHGIIAFTGGFHGRTMGALGVTSNALVSRRYYTGSLMSNVAFAPFANPYRNPFVGDCATGALRFLEEQILDRTLSSEDCAAIIFEPIQGAGGYIVPPVEFVQGLEQICHERGILFIADEVQTGFAKTGYMFACEAFGVEPDILCLSKAIAAGLPMGVTVARADLLDWDFNTHENTLGGNPVVVSAALAALDIFEEEHLVKRAKHIGKRLMQGLAKLADYHELIGDLRGLGTMIGIEFVTDRVTKEPAGDARNAFVKACFERGLLVLGAGPCSVRLSPSLILTDEEINIGLKIMAQALESVS